MARTMRFRAVIPNDVPPNILPLCPNMGRPAKTVYLLHGGGGCCSDWLYNAPLVQLAGYYNLNFVLPEGENSFYLDWVASDRKYAKFVGEEIVDYTRKLFGFSDRRGDTFIGGYSMGGFGALHTGFLYPETFEKIMALSNALIVPEVSKMKPGDRNEIADYDYYKMCFGEPGEVLKSPNNPEELYLRNVAEGKRIPPIYFAVGTEDWLYPNNKEFYDFLVAQNADLTYFEGPGDHNFTFWNQEFEKALKWMLDIK